MAINKISGNILQDNLVRGANLAIQTDLFYVDIFNNRIGINTASTSHTLTVNGDLAVGNVAIDLAGNIDMDSGWINNLSEPVANSDAATKFYVDTELGNIQIANFAFSNTTIYTTITPGNITLAPTGNSDVIIDTVSGLVLPVGNTAQRPSPAATGTVRFNTDADRVEVYDGSEWDSVASGVTNQVLYGDNSTTVFALDRASTTAATLIALNGVIQLPDTAYTVTGNSLTFTQAPAVSDVVDVRFL